MGPFDVPLDDERTQLDAFVEEYRRLIVRALDGLTEEQARRRLVPSATTVLGLVKNVTWMQRGPRPGPGPRRLLPPPRRRPRQLGRGGLSLGVRPRSGQGRRPASGHR